MRPNIPVCELSVLACDECVELRSRKGCINPRTARRISIQPLFEAPLVGVMIRPSIQTFRTLPVKSFVVAHERSGEVPHGCGLFHNLRGIAWGRCGGPKLAA